MLDAILRAGGPSGRVGASTTHLACCSPVKASSVALIPIPLGWFMAVQGCPSRCPTCGFPRISACQGSGHRSRAWLEPDCGRQAVLPGIRVRECVYHALI